MIKKIIIVSLLGFLFSCGEKEHNIDSISKVNSQPASSIPNNTAAKVSVIISEQSYDVTTKILVTQSTGITSYDFSTPSTNINLSEQVFLFSGSAKKERVYIKSGNVFDLTNLKGSSDEIIFAGNWLDFASYLSLDPLTGVINLLKGIGTNDATIVSFVAMSTAPDILVFDDGEISAQQIKERLIAEQSLLELIPTPYIGQNQPSGTAKVKAIALNGQSQNFVSFGPGIDLIVSGEADIDKVFVKTGQSVDASNLKSGIDEVYLTGVWDHYKKEISESGLIVFSRESVLDDSKVERVILASGNNAASDDLIILADGEIRLSDIKSVIQNAPNIQSKDVSELIASTLNVFDQSEVDSDFDNVVNALDVFRFDPNEQFDNDEDGIGNNSDNDDDNDGLEDKFDAAPFDANISRYIDFNFSNVSNVGISESISSGDTQNLTLLLPKKQKRSVVEKFVETILPIANAADPSIVIDNKHNLITWDSNGNVIADAIMSDETMFIAEAVLAPNGRHLFLFTAPDIQNALKSHNKLTLSEEICQLYKVDLSNDDAFECVFGVSNNDTIPQLEIALTSLELRDDYLRQSITFRADGSGLLKSNMGIVLLNPDNTYEVITTSMSAPDGFRKYENYGYWLDDEHIAITFSIYPIQGGGTKQYGEVINLQTRNVVQVVEDLLNSRSAQDGKRLYGAGRAYEWNGEKLIEIQSVGQAPVKDPTGGVWGVQENNHNSEQPNKIINRDTGVEIATSFNESRSFGSYLLSGTGTGIAYKNYAFSDGWILHKYFDAPRDKILTLAGEAYSQQMLVNLEGEAGYFINLDYPGWWYYLRSGNETADVSIPYTVELDDGTTEAREYILPLAVVQRMALNDANIYTPTSPLFLDGNEGVAIEIPNPESERETFCLVDTTTQDQRCANLISFNSLVTDYESSRQYPRLFTENYACPDDSCYAFPGVQNVVIAGETLYAYFKDSTDNQYYQAIASLTDFMEKGDEALTFTPVANGQGESGIIAKASKIKPSEPATFNDFHVEFFGNAVDVLFDYPANAYAKLPNVVVLTNDAKPTEINIERVSWSSELYSATVHLNVSQDVEKKELMIRFVEPLYLKDQTSQYQIPDIHFMLDNDGTFKDTDGDGIKDSLDNDDDNDGVLDEDDAYPLISLGGLSDDDNDGIPRVCDLNCLALGMKVDDDNDNDGILNDNDSSPNGLRGRVIDGYISGATVYLDLNYDGRRNDSEPFSVTGQNGLYSLNLQTDQEQCLAYAPLVVDVPVGAIDSDLGVVSEQFSMVSPPSLGFLDDRDFVNITPLTSVLWNEIHSLLKDALGDELSCDLVRDNIRAIDSVGDSVSSSIQNVVKHYNIPADKIFSDFIAQQDDEISTKAQLIVKGLKKSFAETELLKSTLPDGAWAEVSYFVFSSMDGNELYPNAWYKEIQYSVENKKFVKLVKVDDDLETELRLIYEAVSVTGKALDNSDVNFKNNIEIESRGGDSSPYTCNYDESLQVNLNGQQFEITNLTKYTSDSNDIESCKFESFSESTQQRYVFSPTYYIGDTESNAQFTYSFEIAKEQLTGFTDFEQNISNLDITAFENYINSLPAQFCDTDSFGADNVVRNLNFYEGDTKVTVRRNADLSYSEYREFSDGTSEVIFYDSSENSDVNGCLGTDKLAVMMPFADSGAVLDGTTFTVPASAVDWAGFANDNATIYPFNFANGGSITFTAAIPEGGVDTTVRFRFENAPYPDVDPAFDAGTAIVNSSTATIYTITIPAQDAANNFSSLLMYVDTRDAPVTITDIVVTEGSATVTPPATSDAVVMVPFDGSGAALDGTTFTVPASAVDWAGFANDNATIYPLNFANGSSITFTAAIPEGGVDTTVRFRFENAPFPDVNPAFDAGTAIVNSSTATTYTITIPAQDAANNFSSLLMYVDTRDAPVTITNIVVTDESVPVIVDRDNDGVADEDDVFPDDDSEWLDTDLDGVGDNTDTINNVGFSGGAFGGAVFDDGAYTVPTSSESWAGFANVNESLYPLTFDNGGSITFDASIAEDAFATSIYFRFERFPFDPNDAAATEPSFQTEKVIINSIEHTGYTVEIPARPVGETFSSFLMYIVEVDQAVSISNIEVISNNTTDASFPVFPISTNTNWASWDCCGGSTPAIVADADKGQVVEFAVLNGNSGTVLGWNSRTTDGGTGISSNVTEIASNGVLSFGMKVINAPEAGNEAWLIKIESGGNTGAVEINLNTSNEGVNPSAEWQDFTFNISDLVDAGSLDPSDIDVIMIFPAWQTGADAVYRVSDVKFHVPGSGAAAPVAPLATFIDAGSVNENWALWDCCGGSTPTFVDDVTNGLVAEFAVLNGDSGTVFGLNSRTTDGGTGVSVDATSLLATGVFRFDLKVMTAPAAGNEAWMLKIESGGAAGAVEVNVNTSNEGANPSDAWQTFTFNLIDLFDAGTLDPSDIDVIMLFPAWMTGADAVFRVDNMEIIDGSAGPSVPTTPTTPDPIFVDRDSDGVEDSQDAFPDDASESMDTDFDGVGDNTDTINNVGFSGGAFGGAVFDDGAYTVPTSSESWAGFANVNESLYPLTFDNGGSITFDASIAEDAFATSIYFRFERFPFDPNDAAATEPSFQTEKVIINSIEHTGYTVEIPARPVGETFSSFLMYIVEVDQAVSISNIEVISNNTTDASFPVFPISTNTNWASWDCCGGSTPAIVADADKGQVVEFAVLNGNSGTVLGWNSRTTDGGTGISSNVTEIASNGVLSFGMKVINAPEAGNEAWLIKIESGGNTGAVEINLNTSNEGVNPSAEWQDFTFNISDLVDAGSLDPSDIDVIMIFPAWQTGADAVYRVSDVKFHVPGSGAAAPVAPLATFIDAGSVNENWALWDCCGGSTPTFVDDATNGLVAEFAVLNGDSGTVFGLNSRTTDGGTGVSVDATSLLATGVFRFDLKVMTAPAAGNEAWMLKIESGGAAGAVEVNVNTSNEGANPSDAWQTFTFNLIDLFDAGTLDPSDIDVIMLFPAWMTGADAVFRVDNMEIIDGSAGPSVPTTPTTPDPIFVDRDSDGVEDSQDAFPDDASESMDTDFDGLGDNADTINNVAFSIGAFGGATFENGVYTFPASAESWAGFANVNSSLNPLSFPAGGTLTFTGAIPDGGADVNVRFRFERAAFPDVDPAFETDSVIISGSATSYSIELPVRPAGEIYSSLLLYVETQDASVIINDVVVSANNAVPETVLSAQKQFMALVAADDSYYAPSELPFSMILGEGEQALLFMPDIERNGEIDVTWSYSNNRVNSVFNTPVDIVDSVSVYSDYFAGNAAANKALGDYILSVGLASTASIQVDRQLRYTDVSMQFDAALSEKMPVSVIVRGEETYSWPIGGDTYEVTIPLSQVSQYEVLTSLPEVNPFTVAERTLAVPLYVEDSYAITMLNTQEVISSENEEFTPSGDSRFVTRLVRFESDGSFTVDGSVIGVWQEKDDRVVLSYGQVQTSLRPLSEDNGGFTALVGHIESDVLLQQSVHEVVDYNPIDFTQVSLLSDDNTSAWVKVSINETYNQIEGLGEVFGFVFADNGVALLAQAYIEPDANGASEFNVGISDTWGYEYAQTPTKLSIQGGFGYVDGDSGAPQYLRSREWDVVSYDASSQVLYVLEKQFLCWDFTATEDGLNQCGQPNFLSSKLFKYSLVDMTAYEPYANEPDFSFVTQTRQLLEQRAQGNTGGEPVLADRDNDGVLDEDDAFPDNPYEYQDRNGNGLGDYAESFANIVGLGGTPVDTDASIYIYQDNVRSGWVLWDCCGLTPIRADDNGYSLPSGFVLPEHVEVAERGYVAQYQVINSGASVQGFSARSEHGGKDAGMDLSSYSSDATLSFDLKVVSAPDSVSDWKLKLESNGGIYYGKEGEELELSLLSSQEGVRPVIGEWQTYTFSLVDLANYGLVLSDVDVLLVFPAWESGGGAVYQLDNVQINHSGELSPEYALSDRDNDGVADGNDVFPDDPNEWLDTDFDGVGDNTDTMNNVAFSVGAFGGASFENGVYTFPASAESWAGFANANSSLNPFTFNNGGSISFDASIGEGANTTTIYFKFERRPYDDNDPSATKPSFETSRVVINSTAISNYTVDIPARPADETYSSFLMYIEEQDQAVSISDFIVTSNDE